jgi:hypothetical protein
MEHEILQVLSILFAWRYPISHEHHHSEGD